MESFVGVATIGVATLGVGMSASCLVALIGYSTQKMASSVGVATPIVGTLVVGSYVLCSCNLLPETNKFCLDVLLLCLVLELHKTSSSGLEPSTVFGLVAFVSIISSSKQTTSVLEPFFCRAL
jgi:hypothetical protein